MFLVGEWMDEMAFVIYRGNQITTTISISSTSLCFKAYATEVVPT